MNRNSVDFMQFIRAVPPTPNRMPDMRAEDPNKAARDWQDKISGRNPAIGADTVQAANSWLGQFGPGAADKPA